MANNNITLDNRLSMIESMVSSRVVADIGTDHGKLVGKLFCDERIDFAYLSDISPKSLDKAKALLISIGCDKKAQFIVCDGLQGYQDIKKCDVVIAGMGGEQIIKILTHSKINEIVNSFILQPMKNVIKLREFLVNNNYKILQDVIVKDGSQFYFVIKASVGSDNLTLAEKYFGKSNLKSYSDDFCAYLKYEKAKYDCILNKTKHLSDQKAEYYKVLCEVIKRGEGIC